jgi:hypothetical protein
MAANSYAEQVEANRAALAQARLSDPDEHFPYRHDAVVDLIAADPPMGPGLPGGTDGTDDTSRTVHDYITRAIADASRDYIAAQAAWLADATGGNWAAYEAARDRLVAARLDHRQARGEEFTIGAAARKAG